MTIHSTNVFGDVRIATTKKIAIRIGDEDEVRVSLCMYLELVAFLHLSLSEFRVSCRVEYRDVKKQLREPVSAAATRNPSAQHEDCCPCTTGGYIDIRCNIIGTAIITRTRAENAAFHEISRQGHCDYSADAKERQA